MELWNCCWREWQIFARPQCCWDMWYHWPCTHEGLHHSLAWEMWHMLCWTCPREYKHSRIWLVSTVLLGYCSSLARFDCILKLLPTCVSMNKHVQICLSMRFPNYYTYMRNLEGILYKWLILTRWLLMEQYPIGDCCGCPETSTILLLLLHDHRSDSFPVYDWQAKRNKDIHIRCNL